MGPSAVRAKKALDAMKLLGFSRKQAGTVLRRLLNVYNNNWELIEDECYRAPVDAILDAQDSGQTPAPQLGVQANHEQSEPHGTSRGDQYHSASASQYEMDDDDNVTPLVKRPRMGTSDSGQEQPRQPFDAGRKALALAQQAAERGDPLAIVDALILKDPKPEPEIDVAQDSVSGAFTCRDVPVVPDARPLNVCSSGGGMDMLVEHCETRKATTSPAGARGSIVNKAQCLGSSQHAIPICKNGLGSTVQDTQEASSVELDVASSTMGEVKMSLKCNFDPSKLNISMEDVLRMTEENVLHSWKLPPDFSIGKLMNEVCQSVVQLGTMHSEVRSNYGSLQKEANAPFVKPISYKTSVDGNGNAAEGSSVLQSSEPCLQSSIVAWEPELALCKRSMTHDITDISKGEERVRISIVNEFGSETCPPYFCYIPRNIVFQNASVNISIARIGDEDCCADCSGNCLSASLPCACATATGGEFAYTPEGLVRTSFLDKCISDNHFPEECNRSYCKVCPLERSKNEASPGPCKGHLVRKFIKECWSKCGCGMQCGNRVIQRGVTCNLQVFFTHEGKGWGLRTLEELPKGTFVCEYAGEVLTSTELYERTVESARNGKHMHQVLLDAAWGSQGILRDEEALSLDSTFYGNIGRFINHRCYDANLVQIPVEIETPDHHYYHLAFFTARKVEAFEELTWDYGVDFDDANCPNKAFRCMCGSRGCRDQKNPRGAKQLRGAARGGLVPDVHNFWLG
ncbi:hypothetical protein ACP70R_001430 [Stipagrostis hirtigluma subsp. patula]